MKRTVVDVLSGGEGQRPVVPDTKRQSKEKVDLPPICEELLVRTLDYVGFTFGFQCRAVNKKTRDLLDKRLAEMYDLNTVQLNVLFWDNYFLDRHGPQRPQVVVYYGEGDDTVVFDSIQPVDRRPIWSQLHRVNPSLPSIAALKPAKLSLRGWSVPPNRRVLHFPPYRGYVGTELVNTLAEQVGDYVTSLYLASMYRHTRGPGPTLAAVFSKFSHVTQLHLQTSMNIPSVIYAILELRTLRMLHLRINNRSIPLNSRYSLSCHKALTRLRELPCLEKLEIIPSSLCQRLSWESPISRVIRLKKIDIPGLQLLLIEPLLLHLPCLQELGSLLVDISPTNLESQTIMTRRVARMVVHEQMQSVRVHVCDRNRQMDGFVMQIIVDFCNRSFPRLSGLEIHFDSSAHDQTTAASYSRWVRSAWTDQHVRQLSRHPALNKLKIGVNIAHLGILDRIMVNSRMEDTVEELEGRIGKQVIQVPFFSQVYVAEEEQWWLPVADGRRERSHLPSREFRTEGIWAIPPPEGRHPGLGSDFETDSDLETDTDSNDTDVDSDTTDGADSNGDSMPSETDRNSDHSNVDSGFDPSDPDSDSISGYTRADSDATDSTDSDSMN